jgi:hypothetical protein
MALEFLNSPNRPYRYVDGARKDPRTFPATVKSAPFRAVPSYTEIPVARVAVVADPADPVVFWFSVGTSAATIVLKVGTPAAPLGAAKNVFAVCDEKFEGRTARVPPSVRLPVEVTVPVRVRPETVPVPPTEVTVPVVDEVPAPIAVRNAAAVSAETVLFALICGNVMADGFARVKKL